LEGLNILFNPPISCLEWCREGASVTERIIENLSRTRASERPTRAIVVVPDIKKEGKLQDLRAYARSKKLMEILRFPGGTFKFEDPTGFSQDSPTTLAPFEGEVSIFLFLNTRSLLFDPIDWADVERSLNDWMSRYCPQGEVPQLIRQKFGERLQILGPPRSFGKPAQKIGVINLMGSHHLRADQSHMRKCIKDNTQIKLITQINKGDKGMAAIGLFPHALKKIICEKCSEEIELLDNLSRDIVRACALRFRHYQKLSAKSEELRQGRGKGNTSHCLDPFHFLELIHGKVPSLRSTCV
jgi:hypothetical protein